MHCRVWHQVPGLPPTGPECAHCWGVVSLWQKHPGVLMTDDSDFRRLADADSGQSILAEFWGFLKTNKKWWLGPIVVMLLLLGGLLLLSTTAAAPFIYTLF